MACRGTDLSLPYRMKRQSLDLGECGSARPMSVSSTQARKQFASFSFKLLVVSKLRTLKYIVWNSVTCVPYEPESVTSYATFVLSL
jgi:hypothetical protein